MALNAVLFDLDGTPTDPREGITRRIAYALERMGLEPPPLAAIRDSGARLFVATSKPLVYADRIVRHFDLHAHFVAVHGCELDGSVDMRAARRHGVQAIGALWGYGTVDELEATGAHALCAEPSALPAAVKVY